MSTQNQPRPWDNVNDLLKKILRTFGGSNTPYDNTNNLLVKILERALNSSSVETITYAASVAIDFSTTPDKSITLTGPLVMTTTGLVPGEGVAIRLIDDGSGNALTFPGTWTWLSAVPAAMTAGKTAILSLKSYGTTDADVVAGFAEEP